ncbi:hypothetical protein CYMTET_25713 [Cymbomonas tetramitiformis]|uniref:CULT domain-containing protein n=1 Tax=Cymbomonas tetramitiformis TaxID=36881 RepID=A0AAE0FTB6_9CHLO|nr:hypothetical protein CYMTET_25713 [Cymbomonas tetramitiformis]
MALALVCQGCEYPIAFKGDLLPERWPEHFKEAVFAYELDLLGDEAVWCYSATNPADVRFDVVRLKNTARAVVFGQFNPEHSWFPGTAWRMAHCPVCARHLGWNFAALSKVIDSSDSDGSGSPSDASHTMPTTVAAQRASLISDSSLQSAPDATTASLETVEAHRNQAAESGTAERPSSDWRPGSSEEMETRDEQRADTTLVTVRREEVAPAAVQEAEGGEEEVPPLDGPGDFFGLIVTKLRQKLVVKGEEGGGEERRPLAPSLAFLEGLPFFRGLLRGQLLEEMQVGEDEVDEDEGDDEDEDEGDEDEGDEDEGDEDDEDEGDDEDEDDEVMGRRNASWHQPDTAER